MGNLVFHWNHFMVAKVGKIFYLDSKMLENSFIRKRIIVRLSNNHMIQYFDI
jgi:hypothetical protein